MNAKTIITFAILMFSLITVPAKADDINQQKAYYQSAKQEIEAMLEGNAPLSYERAIYLIENAWYDNKLTYDDFQSVITYNTDIISTIARQNQKEQPQDTTEHFWDALKEYSRKDKGYYEKALTNWAIFKFMTDTTIEIRNGSIMYVFHKEPLQYSTNDPFGTTDWTNTQIIHLLKTGKGNCFALTSLYKIFSERLSSDANICTAPGHIYISHRDDKGTMYNIELASKSFPGTGTLSTLTYSTLEAIRNNISLRELDLQQSVALSLVYLAKGYQHKFNAQCDDDFLLECAELTLKYDTLNLNALLLKAEVLETKLVSQQKEIQELQNQDAFIEYQSLIVNLYQLGYREMPLEMKNFLIKGWSRDSTVTLVAKEHNPDTYSQLGVKYNRYASLSWGLFDEEIRDKPIENYGRTLFNVKSQTVTGFDKKQVLYNNYSFDPVVFAWSVDPMAHAMPGWSPYAAFANNPILNIDPDGNLPWSVHIRSYIATPTTGGGLFRGDGRGPSLSTDKSITSRVRSNFIVDPAKQTISRPTVKSDPTVFFGVGTPGTPGYLPPAVKEGKPKASINKLNFANGWASLDFSHSGKDPLTPQWATPALDVHANLTFKEDLEKGTLNITGSFTGDEFPSTEAFIIDQSGKGKLFLGARMESGGVGDLFGDNKESLFNVNMEVQIDKNGNFTGVKEGDKSYSVGEWNQRVQNTAK